MHGDHTISIGGTATGNASRGDAGSACTQTVLSGRHVRAVGVLLAVAFGVRLLFAVFLFPQVQARTGLSPGSDGYERIAETLASGGGYRFAPDLGETMFVPPAYPLFLAALFKMSDQHLLVTQIAQSILDTISCLLIYCIGRKCLGHWPAFIGASLYALYPGMWIACSRYLSEPLFVCLTLIFVHYFSEFLASREWRGAIVGAASCGVSVLCKSVAGVLPLFLLGASLILPAWRGRRGRAMCGLGIGVVMVVVIVSPWVYRNYRLTGELVYPSTSGGLAVYTAHVYAAHPEQSIRKSVHQAAAEVRDLGVRNGIALDPRDTYPRAFYNPLDEVKLDHLARTVAMEQIATDRAGFLSHIAGNLWRFWIGAPTRTSVVFSILLNGPLLLLATVGFFQSRWWTDRTLSLWMAVSVYLFLSHVAVLAVVRYSLTVMPLVCMLSGYTLYRAYVWRNARRTETAAAGVSTGRGSSLREP